MCHTIPVLFFYSFYITLSYFLNEYPITSKMSNPSSETNEKRASWNISGNPQCRTQFQNVWFCLKPETWVFAGSLSCKIGAFQKTHQGIDVSFLLLMDSKIHNSSEVQIIFPTFCFCLFQNFEAKSPYFLQNRTLYWQKTVLNKIS